MSVPGYNICSGPFTKTYLSIHSSLQNSYFRIIAKINRTKVTQFGCFLWLSCPSLETVVLFMTPFQPYPDSVDLSLVRPLYWPLYWACCIFSMSIISITCTDLHTVLWHSPGTSVSPGISAKHSLKTGIVVADGLVTVESKWALSPGLKLCTSIPLPQLAPSRCRLVPDIKPDLNQD